MSETRWYPIEQVPDREKVLLYCENEGGIFVGTVSKTYQHDYEGSGGTYWNGSDYRPLGWCTHWSPLPNPPRILKEKTCSTKPNS